MKAGGGSCLYSIRKAGKVLEQKRSYRRIGILVAVLLVAAVVAAAAHFFGGGLVRRTTADGMIAGSSEIHVMILGVDERKDDVGRSDTLMVATVDPEKGTASLLSIPRDTRVAIEGAGYDKINAAYAYGGYALTKKTLEQLLDVPMDYYILIDVHAFERIIDALDGIDIDVEKRMYYEDPWDDDGGLLIDLKPGMQHMDGKTAVTYVRYRDEEGDIGRIERQQKFMKAVMEKVTSPAIITRLPTVIKEVMDSIETDLSFRQMLEFAGTLKEAQKNGLKTDMVPGRPLYISEISYWIPDIMKLRQTVANTLDIDVNASMRAAMERESHEYGDTSIGRPKRESSGRSESSSKSSASREDADEKASKKGSKDRASSASSTEKKGAMQDADDSRTRTETKSSGSSPATTPSAAPTPGTDTQKTQ